MSERWIPTGQHLRTLHRTPTASVRDFRCRPEACECGGEEHSDVVEITFPRAGAFVRHIGGREVLADPNRIAFFNRNQPYRVSHPVSGGDDCTLFIVADEIIQDIVAAFDPSVRERPDMPFPHHDAPSSPSLFAFHHRLLEWVASGNADPLAVDEHVLALAEAAVRASFACRGERSKPVKKITERIHARLVGDARTILNERYDEPVTLDGLARQVHSSAYHLARVFRRQTGLSIHRYLNRLRLRAGLNRVASGEPDLTALALDLGFNSHSHFTDAFRREFGVAPSAFRRSVNSQRLREMSTILEA